MSLRYGRWPRVITLPKDRKWLKTAKTRDISSKSAQLGSETNEGNIPEVTQ